MNVGQREHLVTFQRGTTISDNYGADQLDWSSPTLIEQAYARVRFGLAGEQRQAAQERASQTATFEVVPTTALRGALLTDRIVFDDSNWDLTEKAELDRQTLRFTAVRSM